MRPDVDGLPAPAGTDLAALADRANAERAAYEATQAAATAHAVACGEALAEAKRLVGHGRWLPWVQATCDFTERTAQRYMRSARNATRVSHLGSVRKALAELADAQAKARAESWRRRGRTDPGGSKGPFGCSLTVEAAWWVGRETEWERRRGLLVREALAASVGLFVDNAIALAPEEDRGRLRRERAALVREAQVPADRAASRWA